MKKGIDMNNILKAAIGLAMATLSASTFAQVYAGYPDIPATGVGSATSVVSYSQGPGVTPPHNTAEYALGEPNNQSLSLGRSGDIVLTTSPMSVSGDKTSASDFYVYESVAYSAFDVYVSDDNINWTKMEVAYSANNSTGTVHGFDIDSLGAGTYKFIKIVDTSNESGSTSAGADIDGIVIASDKYTGAGEIVDTDTRNGTVFNLEKDQDTGAVDVKKISKDGSVVHIPFSVDDSLEPITLSLQGNFDCDDAKDINVLATRKADDVPLNIIKDQQGNDIATIDNSVTN
ncbi:cell envelope biogenesis protein OmpA [Scandinavium goeteborgense]|uniref:cell envelope biogenesis protein OmpA n=1 Tax=Scandinavium goeteborgense TaxID=1851514 RepID=UPI001FEBFA78|nr:cell envelope biogenesis protein OmpA [Scandinavium goeteborgense]